MAGTFFSWCLAIAFGLPLAGIGIWAFIQLVVPNSILFGPEREVPKVDFSLRDEDFEKAREKQ